MKDMEQAIYGRMIHDSAPTVGLPALLGDATHIRHAYQIGIPEVPYLTFYIYSSVKGQLGGNFQRSFEFFVQFAAYAVNYLDVLNRLRQLFDGYRFDVSGTDVGALRSVWDMEGPDGFDETLEVQFKTVRYRFFVTPLAWTPVIA